MRSFPAEDTNVINCDVNISTKQRNIKKWEENCKEQINFILATERFTQASTSLIYHP